MTIHVFNYVTTLGIGEVFMLGLVWLMFMLIFVGVVRAIRAEHTKKGE